MDFLKTSISTIDTAIEINKLKSDREDLTNKILHLCTFETPTCRRFMSAKVGSICAFQMRKCVKISANYSPKTESAF